MSHRSARPVGSQPPIPRREVTPTPELIPVPKRTFAPLRPLDAFEPANVERAVSALRAQRTDDAARYARLLEHTAQRLERERYRPIPAAYEEQISHLLLTRPQQEQLRDALRGEYGLQAQADVQAALLAVRGLHVAAQVQLLQAIPLPPHDPPTQEDLNASAMVELVTSPGYQALPPDQQEQLISVMVSCGADGLGCLDELLKDPERLLALDSQGQTLLQNLATLAEQPLNAAIPGGWEAHQGLMDSVLLEVTFPEENVDQSVYGTCTVTSMQYELCRDNPSEYVRLISGLTGTSGSATMMGGDALVLQTRYFESHLEGDSRSLSEAIFQAAAMEYGNGERTYDESIDHHFEPDGGDGGRGLGADGQAQLLSQLFGVEYAVYRPPPLGGFFTPDFALDLLEGVDTHGDAPPIIVSLTLTHADGTESGHALTFDHVANGRVYLRNPWGAGTPLDTMGLTLEDPATGLYSVSVEEFLEMYTAITLPVE